MPRPVAVHVSVSMSRPGHRLVLGDSQGRPILDRPDWVSLDVDLEVELDDGSRVTIPEPMYGMGGPLDCTRQELEDRIDGLIFRAPPPRPGDPREEPDQLIRALRARGADATSELLAGLPRTVSLTHEVEVRLARD